MYVCVPHNQIAERAMDMCDGLYIFRFNEFIENMYGA